MTHAHQDPRPQAPPRLTASRLALASKCEGSFDLAHDDHENPAAEKGTAIHGFLGALLADGSFEPGRVEHPAARAVCEGIDPEAVVSVSAARAGDTHSGGLFVEVPFAYDPETAEATVLDSGGHRDYSQAPAGAICGTADVVAFWEEEDGTGCVLITDWKTGGAVEAPHENAQLAFLALCAARAPGIRHGAKAPDRVAAQIAYVDATGEIRATGHEFSPDELDASERTLRNLSRSVANQVERPPRFRVGAHCRYCPAFARCPAQAGAAQALLAVKQEELSDAAVPEIWRNLQAVEAAAKKVRASLRRYVAAGGEPVPIGGGKGLKVVEARREKIDPHVALPLLRDVLGYGDHADGAVTVSKAGLKTLAGPRLGDVMAALDDAGAVEVARSESLREAATGPKG